MRPSLLAPLFALLLTPVALAQPAAQVQRPPAPTQAPTPTPAPTQATAPEQFSGRGVYYFAGNVRCPLAGVGKRGDFHCNRLTIDDEHSQITIDRQARRILLVNTHSYGKKQIVGDFLFLGRGKTADGTQAPVGVHLKIEKKGDDFTADTHAHPTVRESIVSAEVEPFTVVIRNSRGDTQVLAPDQALTAIREPSIGLRLASKLLTAWDNLEGVKEDPTRPGYVLVDISFGFGIGGLSQKILRMQIVSVDGGNAQLIASGTLPEMMQKGVWELRLRALSNLGGDAFARDLFLIGLDGLDLLKPLAKDGMERDNMLTIRMRNGRGTVFFGDKQQAINNAPDVARAYLEFNALGAVAAHQVGVRHSRR